MPCGEVVGWVTARQLWFTKRACAWQALFNPENLWLYGNLSPLVDKEDLELHKKLYVRYAMLTDRVLRQLNKETLGKIEGYYEIEIELDSNTRMYELETAIRRRFNRLLNHLSDKKEAFQCQLNNF